MRRQFIDWSILVVIAIYCASCASLTDPIPVEAIQDLKVNAPATDQGTEVSISGVYFNSSRTVGDIKTEIEGNSLTVIAFSCLPKRDTSGVINLTILVPQEVDTVKFGREATVIWRRSEH